ncbi:hypothetical protein PpBr36_06883 [Pyricularia pennisetigena]|uniref:hypothetical protein n=1 Tax=Pyricularia pennisetigena TaxID=1578925 RepID=UPI00114EDB36|nr:hypothetical protein PpBr36_06883 [Pyricularia pennisetigena]TLS25898.1 hypothetical protein PpBr36_06883 [Pyricularia pennisetigena]
MSETIYRLTSARNGKLLSFLLGASSSFLILVMFNSMTSSTHTYLPSRYHSRPSRPTTNAEAMFEAASNRTLGLDSIFFLNLPHRHDRFDAIAIQSHIADIQITHLPAVDGSTINDQGMPPLEKGDMLASEKGCWRAHANVWRRMLENKIPAVLVLESDAGFDANLRPIMGRLNRAFRELLRKDNPGGAFDDANTHDPWLSRSGAWDYLSVGHCHDSRPQDGSYVVYTDPDSSSKGFDVDDIEPSLPREHKRVVYRAKTAICTAGYLVSLSGAAKLLVRTSMNLDGPVDTIISQMTEAGHLKTYSQRQMITPPWSYIQGVGKGNSNSDIHDGDKVEHATAEGWERLRNEKTAFEVQARYSMAQLNDFALGRAWYHVFGEE